jgi:hypothetical protein
MPSVDKVGRYFPLSFVALTDAGTPSADDWTGWLDAVEVLGRLALDEDAPTDRLMPPPSPLSASVNTPGSLISETMSVWWTDGGPRVEASRLSLPGLPDAARFASMLGHLPPTESAS